MLRNLYFSARRSIIVALTVLVIVTFKLFVNMFTIKNIVCSLSYLSWCLFVIIIIGIHVQALLLSYQILNLELLLFSVTWRLPYEGNKEASQNRVMHEHARDMTYKSKIFELYWSRNCTICWMEADIIQREPWYQILECNPFF